MILRNLTLANPWMSGATLAPFEQMIQRVLRSAEPFTAAGHPRLNVYSGDDRLEIHAEVPGLEAKDLELTVEGSTFTLKGSRAERAAADGESPLRAERSTGAFERVLELPYAVDASKVEASLRHGVLQVVLLRAPEDRPRRIEIRTS